jgi:CRP-like cAMP-binding protein
MIIEHSEIQQIFKGLSCSKEDAKIIASVLKKLVLQKGTTIIKAGDIVLNTYGIQKGCLRRYYTDKQGKEHTLQFAIRGWWISHFTAFFFVFKSNYEFRSTSRC